MAESVIVLEIWGYNLSTMAKKCFFSLYQKLIYNQLIAVNTYNIHDIRTQLSPKDEQ